MGIFKKHIDIIKSLLGLNKYYDAPIQVDPSSKTSDKNIKDEKLKNRMAVIEDNKKRRILMEQGVQEAHELKKEIYTGPGSNAEEVKAMAPFHGVISPEGEFQQLEPKERHAHYLTNKAGKSIANMDVDEVYDEEAKMHAKGWFSVGIGGAASVSGHSRILEDFEHPATKLLAQKVKQLPDKYDKIYILPTNKGADLRGYHVLRRHAERGVFSKPSTIMEFHKNDDIKKEMWYASPEEKAVAAKYHGWISPEGVFHPIDADTTHRVFAEKKLKEMGITKPSFEPETMLTTSGWLRSGLSGTKSVNGSSSVLHDPFHPATKKFISLISDINPDKPVDIFTENDYYHVPHKIARSGNLKKPSVVAEFHKMDMAASVEGSQGTFTRYLQNKDKLAELAQKLKVVSNSDKTNKVNREMLNYSHSVDNKKCFNCLFYEGTDKSGTCDFFVSLNNSASELYNLNITVEPDYICNAYRSDKNKPGAQVEQDVVEKMKKLQDLLKEKPIKTEQHHTVPFAVKPGTKQRLSLDEKIRRLNWHLQNMYDPTGQIKTLTVKEHKKVHGIVVKSDEENMLHLEHYSDKKSDEIKPEFHGTGVSGEERKYIGDEFYHPRSYYYVAGSKPEYLLAHKQYIHSVKVPANKIYDITTDEKNFYDKSKNESGVFHPPKLEHNIKEAGYLGYKMKNYVALFYSQKPHSVKDRHAELGKTNLFKGAMRRLYPFSPQKDVKSSEMGALYEWSTEGVGRGKIKEMNPHAKMRALHKLHSLTVVRRNSQSGEREFLLHRGMSGREGRKLAEGNIKRLTSWTPHRNVAATFALTYTGDAQNFESAWIPESKIHHVPKEYIIPEDKKGGRKTEHEIFVKPHKFDLNKSEDLRKEVYPGGQSEAHGWIDPQGKYYKIHPKAVHPYWIQRVKGMDEVEAHDKGWLTIGRAGRSIVEGNSKYLHNPLHPATITARKLAEKHFEEKVELRAEDPGLDAYVNTDHWVKHGTVPKSQILAEFHKNELRKEMAPGYGQTKAHGWIDPKGKYYNIMPSERHDEWLKSKHGLSFENAIKDGWLVIGRAGMNNIGGRSDVLSNGRHPATIVARKLAYDNFGDATQLHHFDATKSFPFPLNRIEVNTEHWAKHGTIPAKGSVAEFRKGINLFNMNPQSHAYGWISPKGEYHELDYDGSHHDWITERGYTGESDAHEDGWISVGHGGYKNVSGHSSVLNNRQNRATRTARQLVSVFGDDLIEVHHSDTDKIHPVLASSWARHGTIPKSKLAEFHKSDKKLVDFKSEVHLIDTKTQKFNLQNIKNKRFMYNPKSGELILGSDEGGRTMTGSHAEEHHESGVKTPYDEFIRGWVGTSKREYPNGVIHFSPPILTSNPHHFDNGYKTLEMFRNNGANENTIIRHFHPKKSEVKASELIKSTSSLLPEKYSIITADNPKYKANLTGGNKQLESKLKEWGYHYEPVSGKYSDEGKIEQGFLVHHSDFNHINALGKLFGQESVVHSVSGNHKLYYTSGNKMGQHHKGQGMTIHEVEPKNYYSTIERGGKKVHFTLNFDFDKLHKTDNEDLTKYVFSHSKKEMPAQYHAHGWIDSEGKYYKMEPEQNHAYVISRKHGFKEPKEAYEKGWLSIGHGGFSNIQGYGDVLNNPHHPATQTARKLALEHFSEQTGIQYADKFGGYNARPWEGGSAYDVIPTHAFTHGTHMGSQSQIAMWRAGIFNKNNSMSKDMWSGEGARQGVHSVDEKAHGWIDPKGKFYNMKPDELHWQWIEQNHKIDEDTAYKKGWMSIGGAGDANINGHSDFIHNTKHPAHITARNLAKKYFYSDEVTFVETDKEKYHTIPTDHYIKHGITNISDSYGLMRQFHKNDEILNKLKKLDDLIKYKDTKYLTFAKYFYSTLPEEFISKSEELQKHLWGNYHMADAHGWVDPQGAFHKMKPNEEHIFAESLKGKMWGTAYKEGWISIGSAGRPMIHGHSKYLKDPNHPATKTIRKLVGQYFPEYAKISHEDIENEPIHVIDADIFSKYGNYKQYFEKSSELNKSEFKEQDYGYNTHGSWSSIKELRSIERERGNPFRVPKHMNDTHEGIWVTHKPLHSVAYNFPPDYHSHFLREKVPLDNPNPVAISADEHKAALDAFKNPMKYTQKIDVRGAKIMEYDPDGGYLYVRPIKKIKKSDMLSDKVYLGEKNETYIDHGPKGWIPSKNAITRVDKHVYVPVKLLRDKSRFVDTPHRTEEGIARGESKHSPESFKRLTEDIKQHGIKEKLLLGVEPSGKITLLEGTHRALAAEKLGLTHVPAEVRYFALSDKKYLLHKEEINKVDEIMKWVHLLGQSEAHGWIDPKGKYYKIPSGDDHGAWLDWFHRINPSEAMEKGWLSIGHAGESNIQGHSKYLKDLNHPATRTARELAGKHFGDKTLLGYCDKHGGYTSYPGKGEGEYDEIPTSHWVKHGTIPTGVALYRSQVLSKLLEFKQKLNKAGEQKTLFEAPIAPKTTPDVPLPKVEEPKMEQPLTVKGKPILPNPNIKSAKESQFDEENGTLHTPQGSFKIALPNEDRQKLDLFGTTSGQHFDNVMNKPDVQAVHQRAMKNWMHLHNLLKQGKLPDDLIAHAALFTTLSAHNAVPMQELTYSKLVDAMNRHKVDPRTTSFKDLMGGRGKIREELKIHKPFELPEHAKDYWTGKARSSITHKETGEVYKLQYLDALGDKLKHYPDLHNYFKDLVSKYKEDGRGAVSQMMADKEAKKQPMDLPAGMGSKIARYFYSMMGGGNTHVPDTHLVRHLFGLNSTLDSNSHNYLKNILWNPGNHELLNKIDKFYGKHYPTVKYVQDKYFGGKNTEHAIFPAFWLHWLSIAPHEKALGIGRSHAARQTAADHTPYWDTAKKILQLHGLENIEKSTDKIPLAVRTASAMNDLHHKLGEVGANLVFYADILPHLLKGEDINKGIGAGKLVSPSLPIGKLTTFKAVGGNKIEREIAAQKHHEDIQNQLDDKGYADLKLYRGIGRPGGFKSKKVRVFPTAMSSDVRYFTIHKPQAQAMAHLKSGRMSGEVRQYGMRVKNPLIIHGRDDEARLWRNIGEHVAEKHRYKHRLGWNDAYGSLVETHMSNIKPEHFPKKYGAKVAGGVMWNRSEGYYGKDVRWTNSKQFLGEYLRDKGHDAAIFLSKLKDDGSVEVPTDGMSQVVIPHHKEEIEKAMINEKVTKFMKSLKVIAIDFDNTIAISEGVEIKGLKPNVKESIQKLKDRGYRIIIWSARNNPIFEDRDKNMKEMKAFLDKHQIPYDKIDDGRHGKPVANYYVDDRAVSFKDNWQEIADVIVKKKKEEYHYDMPFSDNLRLEYLKNPHVTLKEDKLETPSSKYLHAVSSESDYTHVIDTPNFRILHECWLPQCKQAFAKKYGGATPELIKEKMTERMKIVGNKIGMKLHQLNYNRGISSAIFKKNVQ